MFGRACAGGRHLAHRVQQFRGAAAGVAHFGVIDAAAILQLTRRVQPEEIRRADRAPVARHLLCLVDKIGKAETVSGGEAHHLVGAVIGVGGIVVRHDGDGGDAIRLQRRRVGDKPVDHRHHIGAVVADESDKKPLFTHQTVKAAGNADRIGKGKGRGFPAEITERGVGRHYIVPDWRWRNAQHRRPGARSQVTFAGVMPSLERHRQAGPRGFLCRLAHAHRPDAVIKTDLDRAGAAHDFKEPLMLVIG